MSFESISISEPILRALKKTGYTQPTPIQSQAIPALLQRRDVLGCAQTGTGKTAAFSIPIIQLMSDESPIQRGIRCLMLSPTRELAIQIGENFATYSEFTRLNHTVIFGGVSQVPQVAALQKNPDVLIATPGRLLDLMQQGFIRLDQIRYFVLDEADRMLDMGFIHDVKKIIAALPDQKQTLLFSATMAPEIVKIADKLLKNPVKVAVTPPSTTVEKIRQHVYFTQKTEKGKLLIHVLREKAIPSALVFTRTKHGANKVVQYLGKSNIQAAAIHGNKSQTARQNALNAFKKGQIQVLVATDIAARGIDIDELGFVFNYDLPNVPETYVHRIGRTGRAGHSGTAISFCDEEERTFLRDIQKLISLQIPVVKEHPFNSN